MKPDHLFTRLSLTGALILIPVSGLLGASWASAKAAPPTHLMSCTHALTIEPSSYIISCADAGLRWSGVKWSSWGATSALGHGTFVQNNCTPNCAMGTFLRYSATIRLTKVVTRAHYGKLFSEAVVEYRPNGKPKSWILQVIDS